VPAVGRRGLSVTHLFTFTNNESPPELEALLKR
jgi:hypothetical protein